jgi:hypothetical protein
VDALHFDAPPGGAPLGGAPAADAAPAAGSAGASGSAPAAASEAAPAPGRAPVVETAPGPAAALRVPVSLLELRQALLRAAERGTGAQPGALQPTALQALTRRLADAGLPAFDAALAPVARPGERLLRLNYLGLQCERLLLGDARAAESEPPQA